MKPNWFHLTSDQKDQEKNDRKQNITNIRNERSDFFTRSTKDIKIQQRHAMKRILQTNKDSGVGEILLNTNLANKVHFPQMSSGP